MTTKGTKILSSGNELVWENTETPEKGFTTGLFRDEPTRQDEAEAMDFIMSMMPEDAETVMSGRGVVPEQAVQIKDHFLHGGSRN